MLYIEYSLEILWHPESGEGQSMKLAQTRLGQSHLHQNLFPLGGEGGVLRLLHNANTDATRVMVIDGDQGNTLNHRK